MVEQELLNKCARVADELARREAEIAEADASIGFVNKHSVRMTKNMVSTMKNPAPAFENLKGRRGICGKDEEVAILLAYNMSSATSLLVSTQLAIGNRVRIKPSEIAVASGKIMGDIWGKVSPENVAFDFRQGPEFMQWAIQEPKIKAILLFGSHLVALHYMDAIKKTGKRFVFEGPGKNPFIVLEDADVNKAAAGLCASRFMGAGQICASPGRMYIHSKIYDQFLEYFVEMAKKLVVGDPRDPKTDIGPLGSPLAVTRIQEQLVDAEQKGGKIIFGGKIQGSLVYPTIIANANHDMTGMKEESFGPICWFKPYDSLEELFSLVKDNKFGLQMIVYGHKNVDTILAEFKGQDYCHEVPDYLFGKFGTILVNMDMEERLRARDMSGMYRPVGGYGYSGWICDTVNGKFILKQGPKIFARETSEESK